MKDWLRAVVKWLDDPMTQAAIATFGALAIFNGVVRAQASADAAHLRLDDLEQQTMRIIRTHS
jgi:molybdopterin synthase catalytic subunit